MPFDGHSFLVAQGWSGSGTGLRQGAISRPITISQKKTLSGIGKDRDEAFPFWDHLFAAAAKSITVKITSSDDEDDNDDNKPGSTLRRTTTGILCNKRPIDGTPVTCESSGSNTPDLSTTPRMSLLAIAKQEAAKRGLYSNFFRGPVLGPDPSFSQPPTLQSPAKDTELVVEFEPETKKRKKEKAQRKAEKEERREKKRRKREAKAVTDNAQSEKAERKRRRTNERKAKLDVSETPAPKKRRTVDESVDEQPKKKKRK